MLSREIFVLITLLLGSGMFCPLDGRVRNIGVERRWGSEADRAPLPMFEGRFDVQSPDQSPFRGGSDRKALETLSRLQDSANQTFNPLVNSSRYTSRLNLHEKDGRFSVEDRFGTPLFLKNPAGSVEIGAADVVSLPMSGRWNATFSDFVDWWAPDYDAASGSDAPDLSLQDVNRYQFRRSHSSEPGLPVRQAGGGE